MRLWALIVSAALTTAAWQTTHHAVPLLLHHIHYKLTNFCVSPIKHISQLHYYCITTSPDHFSIPLLCNPCYLQGLLGFDQVSMQVSNCSQSQQNMVYFQIMLVQEAGSCRMSSGATKQQTSRDGNGSSPARAMRTATLKSLYVNSLATILPVAVT
jgi:hypothetical protein